MVEIIIGMTAVAILTQRIIHNRKMLKILSSTDSKQYKE